MQSVKANEQSKAVMVDVTSDSVLPAVTSMLAEIGYPASNA